ncbi:MAG: LytTR family DNA-binding domain-containing protein [Syntrophomonadaceae bacterium]
MTKALILEDEEYNREFIKQILSDIPGIMEIFATPIGQEAINWAKENHPQIALLDIELTNQKANGLDVAREISRLKDDIYIVFVTGYSKYAVESFEVHPYGYVLKPIRIAQLKDLLEEIVDRIQQQKQTQLNVLTVKVKNEVLHLNYDDIIFMEVDNHKLLIHSLGEVWEVRKSLDEIEDMLGEEFIRVHRSFIVNLTKVKKVRETYDRSYEIEFQDYPKIALMSRYYYPKYKEFFQV